MAEKEYVEREALIDTMQAALDALPKGAFNPNKIGFAAAIEGVKNFPAADVRAVVRASWEEKEKDGVWWYACSVCGEHIPKGRWGQEWHSNFCPNCGAKMEG